MFESSHRHRTACAVALAVVLTLAIAPFALALAATPAHVVEHRCSAGAVVAIAIQVDKPGVAIVAWDNAKVCGPTV